MRTLEGGHVFTLQKLVGKLKQLNGSNGHVPPVGKDVQKKLTTARWD